MFSVNRNDALPQVGVALEQDWESAGGPKAAPGAEETWRSFVEHSSTATRILADTPEHDEEGSFQLS